jgi:hypothetical protein
MISRRSMFKNYVDERARSKKTTKLRAGAKVEHAFRILKRTFGRVLSSSSIASIASSHHRSFARRSRAYTSTPHMPPVFHGQQAASSAANLVRYSRTHVLPIKPESDCGPPSPRHVTPLPQCNVAYSVPSV